MKKLLISLLLFPFFEHAVGQVWGKLTTADGQPVAFANVLLLKSTDTTAIKAAFTNEAGNFRLENIAPGKYVLRLSSIGYQTWHSEPFDISADEQKDFGTHIMIADKKELGAVVVRAEKPLYQQRPEGTIVNVENSVLTKGSSVLEVLERSPGIVIDRRNNDISLNGKNGILVMLNGKLMRMPIDQVVNLLNGMSANDVEKIELLSSPPAGYDAEGSAGIINIVMKKNKKQGTNGSFSATAGYGWGEKAAATMNLAHNTKKIGLYGSYSFLHDRTYTNMFITSSQNMPVLGGQSDVLVWDTARATQNNHDVTLGIDINVNPGLTIGSNINLNTSARSTGDRSHSDFIVHPDSLLFYHGYIYGTNRWKNIMSSWYAEQKLGEGEKINVDVDYLYFSNDNPSDVQSSFINKEGAPAGNNDSMFSPVQKGFAHTTIQVGVVKADYTRALNKKLKLETGFKGTYTNSRSGSRIESLIDNEWVNRSETVNDIIMNESIGALYASVNAQIATGTSLTIGARYEHASTEIENPSTKERVVNRKRGVLFPNVMFSRKLNDNAELQLSFTKRISRPTYNDLASFVRYSDPTAIYTGNPLLKPTITHNIKVGYNYRNYAFSVLFSRDDHPIARYQITESEAKNLLYISPQNVTWQNSITLQASLPIKINTWWNMNYTMGGGWNRFKVDYTVQPATKTYYRAYINFSETFALPKKYTIELSGWYTSSFYNGSTKVGSMGAVNAGIKKELKNMWGTLQLTASDFLRLFQINTYYGTFAQEAFSIANHVHINTETRIFPIIKLTYTKSFGTAIQRQRNQSTGSGDERERIRRE